MAEVQFRLASGGEVSVDIPDPPDRGGLVGADDVGGRASRTFEEAVAGLKPVAEAVLAQIQDLAQSPEEVALEFGVTLKIEAGVLIARTAADGNFKVQVKWKRSRS